MCFEEKRVKTPTEIICLICSMLTYWAGLQKDAVPAQIEHGAEVLKKTALQFHQHGRMDGGDNHLAVI